jgi:hypothetical protein
MSVFGGRYLPARRRDGRDGVRLAILQFMQKIVGGSYIALLVDRSVMDMDHGKRTKVR